MARPMVVSLVGDTASLFSFATGRGAVEHPPLLHARAPQSVRQVSEAIGFIRGPVFVNRHPTDMAATPHWTLVQRSDVSSGGPRIAGK